MQKDPISDMLSEGDPNTDVRTPPGGGTVVVTGSSGLIGYRLCEHLADSYNVVGLDRPGVPHPPPQVDRIDVDLTSDEDLKLAFQKIWRRYGSHIASVIHLAAYYDFSGKPSRKYDEITVQGTARLLRILKSFDVEQFVFSSTILIHAPSQPGRRINEDSPLEPKWDYPKSKAETENLIHRERGPIPAVFARIAGVYDDDCHSLPLSHQIQRIYERSLTSHLFPGDLSRGQSFVHLDDVVAFLTHLISHRKELDPEQAFLVGEPRVLSYQVLQNELGRLIHGEPWKTIRVPKWFAKLGARIQDRLPFIKDPFIKPWMIDLADDAFELDVRRAQNVLGWVPRYRLQESLPRMVARLKTDPLGWYLDNNLDPPAKMKQRGSPPSPPGSDQKQERPGGPTQIRRQELVGLTPSRREQ